MPFDPRIGAYKVGGRGDGASPLSLPENFRDDVFDVFFDADADAVAQITERTDPAYSRIFPYCLADRNGPGTLYSNYDPYTSSLLKPNRAFDWMEWALRIDYPHAETTRCVSEVPVELRTLDSLDLLADPAIAPPTAIYLDTQGTELAILQGGAQLLREHTVAIVAEAEFLPFYEGQPLFGDLSRWLDGEGFIFAGFADGPYPIEPFRLPLGQRGRAMVGFCDALFLRRVETLARPEQIVQLAFLALHAELLPYAFHCLDRLEARGVAIDAGVLKRSYGSFTLTVDRVRKEMPVLYPPSFAGMYPTYAESTARFDPRFSRDAFQRRIEARYATIRQQLLAQGAALEALASDADSPIERVYRAYGLLKQADAIKARRLKDVTEMLSEFGIGIEQRLRSL